MTTLLVRESAERRRKCVNSFVPYGKIGQLVAALPPHGNGW